MTLSYDELRLLAIPAVTTPSLHAEGALEVLEDALTESGVFATGHTAEWVEFYERLNRGAWALAHARAWRRSWCFRWAMKAVYGGSKVRFGVTLAASAEPDGVHRRWSEERLAATHAGVRWQQRRRPVRVRVH